MLQDDPVLFDREQERRVRGNEGGHEAEGENREQERIAANEFMLAWMKADDPAGLVLRYELEDSRGAKDLQFLEQLRVGDEGSSPWVLPAEALQRSGGIQVGCAATQGEQRHQCDERARFHSCHTR